MIAGASDAGWRQSASAGTYAATSSSSRRRPSSRSRRIVAAVKLLVIDAMRKTVR